MIDYPTVLKYKFPLSENGYGGFLEIDFLLCNGVALEKPIDKDKIKEFVNAAADNIKKNFS